MDGFTTIFEIPLDKQTPGYWLEGGVIEGADGSKTLELCSVVPGARVPDPHRLVSVSLPPEGFAQLIGLLEPHTKKGTAWLRNNTTATALQSIAIVSRNVYRRWAFSRCSTRLIKSPAGMFSASVRLNIVASAGPFSGRSSWHCIL